MQKLKGDTPGKVGGHPGDAFDCVYAGVADAVRTNMHAVDPVLTEYIRQGLPLSALRVPHSALPNCAGMPASQQSSPAFSLLDKLMLQCGAGRHQQP